MCIYLPIIVVINKVLKRCVLYKYECRVPLGVGCGVEVDMETDEPGTYVQYVDEHGNPVHLADTTPAATDSQGPVTDQTTTAGQEPVQTEAMRDGEKQPKEAEVKKEPRAMNIIIQKHDGQSNAFTHQLAFQ